MKKGSALLVAGTHRGSGKTTVACAILDSLRRRGLKAQPFKAGPDHLDTARLAQAAERTCPNLDLWMMPRKAVAAAFSARMVDADFGLVDGMAGLYDDLGAEEKVSSASLASLLRVPVLLVIDAGGMAESAAAIARGFATYGRAAIAGIVFNRVTGPEHFDLLKRAVGHAKVCGWLPRDAEAAGAETVDLDAILGMARVPVLVKPPSARPKAGRVKIAVARDAAFHFYYEGNLDALRAAGAEIAPFSPLADAGLPEGAAGLYLGGCFPENQAPGLEANRSMRDSILNAVMRGMPTYAECGGLMYLSAHLVGTGVRAWEMVGALPGEVRLQRGQDFGYVTASAERGTFLVEKGETLRGCEFRSSIWTAEGGEASIYRLRRSNRGEARPEGFGSSRLHASRVHLHFASAPRIPARFVKAAEEFASSSKH